MAAIEYERSLRLSGFTPDQAEAIATGYVDKTDLVTKDYLRAELKTFEISLLTKVFGVVVFALSPVYIKLFGG
jgi:hypothetical protein